MKVTKVEIIRSKEPIPLPIPWRAAWTEPSGKHVTSLGYSFYKLYTDEGIVGIGPNTGAPASLVEGFDPFCVGEFWNMHMSGQQEGASGKGAAGLEIALWDIVGKAANQPIANLLGKRKDKLPVYAATSRLLSKEEHIRQVREAMNAGFKAVKLRMHRPDPWEDLAAVAAVREAVGDGIEILVDANQNNKSEGYNYWSLGTSLKIAEELEKLNVYFMEEPRPRLDVRGLAVIADSVDMFIAGGEHSPTIYDFRDHLVNGAYDIIQPDVILGGNMGITGVKRAGEAADYFGKMIIPHVCSGANTPIYLAATLHAMATVDNCPMVEYSYDPPILTVDTCQAIVKEPFLIDEDGCLKVPDGPGLGIEIDEEKLSENLAIG